MKGQTAQTEAPLSNRERRTWNLSPVVVHLILWLCDVTPLDRVKHLHNDEWLVWHIQFNLAQLLCCL